MFRQSFFFILSVLSLFTLSISCNENEEVTPTTTVEDLSEVTLETSEKSVSELRSTLQENGLLMHEEMQKMSDTKTADALVSFINISENAEIESSEGSSPTVFITPVIKAIDGNSTLEEIGQSMRSLQAPEEDDDDFSTFKALWNDFRGTTLTYDALEDDFNETENDLNKFQILFPLVEGGSNNVVFSIDEFTSHVVTNADIKEDLEVTEPDFDFPKSLKASLTIDGTLEMSYSINIAYGSDDIPTALSTTTFINPFTISTSFSNDGEELRTSLAFVNGETNIYSYLASLQGDVSWNSIDQASQMEEPDPLKLESAYFQISLFDVALRTTASNIEGMVNDITEIDDNYDYGYEIMRDSARAAAQEVKYAADMEKVIDDHIAFDLFFISDGEKIADTKIEVIPQLNDSYCFNSGVDEICTYNFFSEPDLTMTFADGGIMTAEEFVEVGFETLESAFEDLFDDLDEDFD